MPTKRTLHHGAHHGGTPRTGRQPAELLAPSATFLGGVVGSPNLAWYSPAVPDRITLGSRPFADSGLRFATPCRCGPRRTSTAPCANGTTPAAHSAADRMTGLGKGLQRALHFFEVLLAKVERVCLSAVAEGYRIRGGDFAVLQVASNHYLRDPGHY